MIPSQNKKIQLQSRTLFIHIRYTTSIYFELQSADYTILYKTWDASCTFISTSRYDRKLEIESRSEQKISGYDFLTSALDYYASAAASRS